MKIRTRIAALPLLRSPGFRYGLLALALGLWAIGLVEQIYDSAATMKYVLMSLLMLAIAAA